MSNSGLYKDDDGKEIEGTPLLVSEIVADAMTQYPDKKAYIYFNDLDSGKIDLLKTRLPKQTGNFTIYRALSDTESDRTGSEENFEDCWIRRQDYFRKDELL